MGLESAAGRAPTSCSIRDPCRPRGRGVVLEGELRAVVEGVVMWGFASGEERAAGPQGSVRMSDVGVLGAGGRGG